MTSSFCPLIIGVSRLANLDGERRLRLLKQLAALERAADIVLIETQGNDVLVKIIMLIY